MEKRLHEAKLSGTLSHPAVNEIYLQPRVEGKAQEGAVDRHINAIPTHLPCNPLELRTVGFSCGAQRSNVGCNPLLAHALCPEYRALTIPYLEEQTNQTL